MIEFLSSWVKGLGLAIVAVSILEMLLPNNKNKKYIRAVMGIFILFNIISPFVENKKLFDIEDINLEAYTTNEIKSSVNQTSMDERIQELYIQELEKDISKKLGEKGYEVTTCKVSVKLEEDDSKITKIKLTVKKEKDINTQENSENQQEIENDEYSIENKIVTEIQKVKKIDTSIEINKKSENKEDSNQKVSKSDIQNIKKFLIEEYGVNEKCLEIN